ncbi:MAG: hypothetical protein NT069_00705 [Planctomycetota bacterium]|nr:hypothetical protein [Planctomycetota bacterium]
MELISRAFDFLTQPFRWIFGGVLDWFSALRPVWGIALPWRLALFALLICLATAGLVLYIRWPIPPHWTISVLVLAIAIPLGVHWLTHLWLQEPDEGDPAIAKAWRDGLAAFAQVGASIENQPLVLVSGLAGSSDARALFSAAGYELEIDGSKTQGVLQWFLTRQLSNPDRKVAFLSLNGVSCLSALLTTPSTGSGRDRRYSPRDRGSITGDESVAPGNDSYGAADSVPDDDTDHNYGDDEGGYDESINGADESVVANDRSTPKSKSRGPENLPDIEIRRLIEGLKQVSDLLRRARNPFVPINGMLVVLPYSLVSRSASDTTPLKTCLRYDFENLATALELQFPATVVVTGIDDQRGFVELIKRLETSNHSKSRDDQESRDEGETARGIRDGRFGKGGDALTVATDDFVDAVVLNACGLFEDRTLMMFRGKEGLANPTGNRKLFSLVCAIRSHIQPVLIDVLRFGFCGKDGENNPDLVRMGGCYFAKLTKEPAFVRAVFEKVEGHIGRISWTDKARNEDRRFVNMADFIRLFNAALFVGMIALLVKKLTG